MNLSDPLSDTRALKKNFNAEKNMNQPVIALAGNPNTGKSTVFNALTGLHQHTGNWPGKTVLQAQGSFIHKDLEYHLVDLPGTYSLLANSKEEEVTRDFLYFAKPDAAIVVTDATCLERNLNLVYQIMEIMPNVVVCVNLIDEARRKKVFIDIEKLQEKLGVPVVPTIARSNRGLDILKDTVSGVIAGRIQPQPNLVKYDNDIENAVDHIIPILRQNIGDHYNLRWLALKLLDGEKIDNPESQMV